MFQRAKVFDDIYIYVCLYIHRNCNFLMPFLNLFWKLSENESAQCENWQNVESAFESKNEYNSNSHCFTVMGFIGLNLSFLIISLLCHLLKNHKRWNEKKHTSNRKYRSNYLRDVNVGVHVSIFTRFKLCPSFIEISKQNDWTDQMADKTGILVNYM